MVKLKKIKLDYSKTYDYFQYNLFNSNKLCKIALKKIKNGSFYTFLPSNVKEEKVYNFNSSGIAKHLVEVFPAFLLDMIKNESPSLCYFDAINFSYKPGFSDPLFMQFGRYSQHEVYYQVAQQDASLDVLSACSDRSYAIWHSFCMISSSYSKEKAQTEFTNNEMETICEQTYMILLLAYDGEGYIIWDKNNNIEKYEKINNLNSCTSAYIEDQAIKDWTKDIEILHPDLKHEKPIGPHWDYVGPNFPKPGIRLMPDGSWVYKNEEY